VALIELDGVEKTFTQRVRRGRLRRERRVVRAVDGVSFEIEAGSLVGYVGPNGAGKSTTVKMLTGILVPSRGRISVAGLEPSRRRIQLARRIGVVFGQRVQLWWDLPLRDSFELLRHIYRVPFGRWRANLDSFAELLELGPFLDTPVRQLSLGQRMRGELTAAMLHDPEILFLDEPTIGLDVTMQKRIRSFVAEYNRRHDASVLLTSHYMADVVALCKRVIVIHHGRILFDGNLAHLSDRFAAYKTINVDLADGAVDLDAYGDVLERDGDRTKLRVPKAETPRVAARLLSEQQVADLTIEDPPIEDVIELVFAEGV
jgi:ABC-2 type transport system ATP-binding protein